ncbi:MULTISPECIES: type II toxin-antitoxin system VapC family toxin [Aurantimonadaceae]|uniref:PIN domain-containing protein n=2 Tax=Jiella TaxID=1775688 RepID=A0A6N9T639_9HYPH|nr:MULTISPECIES: type II toxin-antitoxin system VapC family toxin [Aurantimonadaceae]MAU95526.1 PIN domain-containing protein [Fulvimarina sp.]NDW06730.1 PIN domain-containing protein [Jiella pacifica]ORE97061.1 plasmid stability protein [Aurantimonas sp. 22II-16-19i]WAP71502.1 type II toxin-antitoxin system VapC family toxin [Jiella pelagia]
MAYLLDTNVVSEIRKGLGSDATVLAYMRGIDHDETRISVITIMEIARGIELIERRGDIQQAAVLSEWFQQRVLGNYDNGQILQVTTPIAVIAGKFQAANGVKDYDSLIAATAKHYGLILLTRNVKDFVEFDIELECPWQPINP